MNEPEFPVEEEDDFLDPETSEEEVEAEEGDAFADFLVPSDDDAFDNPTPKQLATRVNARRALEDYFDAKSRREEEDYFDELSIPLEDD